MVFGGKCWYVMNCQPLRRLVVRGRTIPEFIGVRPVLPLTLIYSLDILSPDANRQIGIKQRPGAGLQLLGLTRLARLVYSS